MSHSEASKPIAPEELHALIVEAQRGAAAAAELQALGVAGIMALDRHTFRALESAKNDGVRARSRKQKQQT